MSTRMQIVLSLLVGLLLVVGGGLLYLYTDDPYEGYPNESALVRTPSTDIPRTETPARLAATDPSAPPNIQADGRRFVAPDGRTMYLRGINLGGSSKVPYGPRVPTHVRESFFEGRTVSFVGRPFPLKTADRHFARLKKWGFHFVRLLVTWEAIEHEGPGIYDEAYLDYIEQIVEKAGAHGINVFIDPHQDVFSRFSGGDGAPMWTFEKVGLDVRTFQNTGAALVHNLHGDPYPRMGWSTNYDKMAAATMFTLFFGGNDFAPKRTVEGEPVQAYLQRHYVDALKQVALRLKGQPNVIGFEVMNEPSPGVIGVDDLTETGVLKVGPTPTYFQGMVLAAGISQTVGVYELGMLGMEEVEQRTLNADGVSSWKAGASPVWKQHGVWDLDEAGRPELLKPAYFTQVDGEPVDFSVDYYKPFVDRFARAIHGVDPEWLIFVEPPLSGRLPAWPGNASASYVNAGHWYDVATLLLKTYSPVWSVDQRTQGLLLGKTAIREAFEAQLAHLKTETRTELGSRPTLVGEFGIPFDLNDGEAYRTGDFSDQVAALDRSFNAVEENSLSYTLWNYTADNTNERGDQWNGEDLSIFSRDQQANPSDIHSGGRALDAVIRPYPYKVAGTLITYQFNHRAKEVLVRYRHDPALDAPTDIFLPEYHYGDGFEVLTQGGTLAWNEKHDLLRFTSENEATEQVIIVRAQ